MNLITNSTFQTNVSGTLHIPPVTYGSGTLTVVEKSLGNGLPANYLTILQATDKTGVYFDFTLKANTPYVFSVFGKAVVGGSIFYLISTLDGVGAVRNEVTSGILGTGWSIDRHVIKFTTPPASTKIRIDLYQHDGGSVKIAAVQLEEGLEVTPFAIAPSGPGDEISEGSSGDMTLNKLTVGYIAKINPNERCAYNFAGTLTLSAGNPGIIPFPTLIEDAATLRAWTVLSTGDADTNTPDHLLDANGVDWTTIDALLAPVYFPVYNSTDDVWCIADSVAAHDITLSKDDFPDGDETYVIYKPTFTIPTTGLYLIYIHINIPTVEKKAYDISIMKSITSPAVVHQNHWKPTETGEQTFSFACVETLTAGMEIYVKLNTNTVGEVVIDTAEIVIIKL